MGTPEQWRCSATVTLGTSVAVSKHPSVFAAWNPRCGIASRMATAI